MTVWSRTGGERVPKAALDARPIVGMNDREVVVPGRLEVGVDPRDADAETPTR